MNYGRVIGRKVELNGTEWNRLQLDGPCLEQVAPLPLPTESLAALALSWGTPWQTRRQTSQSNRQLWEQNQKAKAPKQRGDGTRRRGMGDRMIRIDTAYLLAQMYEVSVDELIEQ